MHAATITNSTHVPGEQITNLSKEHTSRERNGIIWAHIAFSRLAISVCKSKNN